MDTLIDVIALIMICYFVTVGIFIAYIANRKSKNTKNVDWNRIISYYRLFCPNNGGSNVHGCICEKRWPQAAKAVTICPTEHGGRVFDFMHFCYGKIGKQLFQRQCAGLTYIVYLRFIRQGVGHQRPARFFIYKTKAWYLPTMILLTPLKKGILS